MTSPALLIATKDINLHCGFKSSGYVQAILLGLLLIFLFSLSLKVGEQMPAQGASSIFWMASCFCQIFIFNTLYAHEETHGQRNALLLAPIYAQSIWLGKAIAGLLMLLLSQCVFFPAILIFLNQDIQGDWLSGLSIFLTVNIGMVSLGSLLGALSQGNLSRQSLFSVIIFPLLIPLLLAGIRGGTAVLSKNEDVTTVDWWHLALAFDAIFIAACNILFPYLFTADD